MDFERYLQLRSKLETSKDSSSKSSDIKYAFVQVLEKEKKDGGTPLVIQKSSGTSGRDTSEPYGQYAIVERDRINAKGEIEGTDLEIQSEILQDALCAIIGQHSQVGTRADPIVFKKPYYALFHCRHELKRMEEGKSNTPDQKQHLKWLNEFIATNLKPLEKVQTGLVEKGLVDFKHIPIIFEVGSVVVGHIAGDGENIRATSKPHKTKQPECFVFYRIADEAKDEKTGTKYLEIELIRWGFNGYLFGLTKERARINAFAGARKITDLEFKVKLMM
ncbi:hypothetical protein Micbo1qcDRAFT_193979 [Microdochium bolleyi]|uniref:DUF7025 domain-containing protein n=1 Tax=Microdochium bolleyi TaxID=196109 RepID=A0A136J6B0_9PEZI|nr:hypothetical protein Micbo1qcDRAFT_193979 [Microdochium bolleyi]